ncbi:diadenylate cyclase CdaA [Synechococcus sp. PCC 7336]|uniref:diadenylate cyclase CdaA n=1 Tax=Synechococcus sp. PCC 7336 TaxID=195250 RepID=UPI00037DA944|nr:diadenylate cyclase CdaA [Synechococcus sp. PCC 7336]
MLVDWGLVILLICFALYVTRKTRAVWLVRGYVLLLLLSSITRPLTILHQVLNAVVIGAAVALAVLFQPELRKLLEQLGRGDWFEFLPVLGKPSAASNSRRAENAIDELVQAVRELSQNRIGALIVLELEQPIDARIFTEPGVPIQGNLSKELLQTIFQPSTLLHDGAVLVKGDRLKAAGVILPMSDRVASRQLGTRHRAAMGITEQTRCLCIVVSEETGSISLAEAGRLERPLTSAQLRELLVKYLQPQLETGTMPVSWKGWTHRIVGSSRRLISVVRETLSKE